MSPENLHTAGSNPNPSDEDFEKLEQAGKVPVDPEMEHLKEALSNDDPSEDDIEFLREAAARTRVDREIETKDGKRSVKLIFQLVNNDTGAFTDVDGQLGMALMQYAPKVEELPIYKNLKRDHSQVEISGKVPISSAQWDEIKAFTKSQPAVSSEFLQQHLELTDEESVAAFRALQAEGLVSKTYEKNFGYRVGVERHHAPEVPSRRKKTGNFITKHLHLARRQFLEGFGEAGHTVNVLTFETYRQSKRAKEDKVREAAKVVDDSYREWGTVNNNVLVVDDRLAAEKADKRAKAEQTRRATQEQERQKRAEFRKIEKDKIEAAQQAVKDAAQKVIDDRIAERQSLLDQGWIEHNRKTKEWIDGRVKQPDVNDHDDTTAQAASKPANAPARSTEKNPTYSDVKTFLTADHMDVLNGMVETTALQAIDDEQLKQNIDKLSDSDRKKIVEKSRDDIVDAFIAAHNINPSQVDAVRAALRDHIES